MSPDQTDSATTVTTAPVNIKIYCVIVALVSLIGVGLSLKTISTSGPTGGFGMVFLGSSAANLVVLYGLWTLKSWSWTWAMVLFFFDAVINLFPGSLAGTIINAVFIGYLWSKRDYYDK
ncbi:MAG: hypothetical protein J07HX5_00097 [halophilic archaeon J07HX5]|jgi:hypothetical protein|nr:MAG: hypothetical protein J07HX5_00097 [halophilic archaeon J07HX5]